jgi:hypothetical protein
METTKTAEAPESATVTEVDAEAVEVVTDDKDVLAANDTTDKSEIENEIEIEADDELDDEPEFEDGPAPVAGSGVPSAAAAVVGAGLGLSSLTGTWIATMMADRQNIIAQAAGKATTTNQQIAQYYGTPWHTTALFNGFFAIAAVLVTVAVLLAAKNSPVWVRALAWGGLALGVIGLFIAGVMWFDVFTDIPTVAATATS